MKWIICRFRVSVRAASRRQGIAPTQYIAYLKCAVKILNLYLGIMADVINELMGDGIFMVFGAPNTVIGSHVNFRKYFERCQY
jgi:class 3 adenylate cyclase